VNYGTEAAKLDFDSVKTNVTKLSSKIEPLGYTLVQDRADDVLMQSAAEMGMSEDEHREHLGLTQSKAEKLAEIKDMRKKVSVSIPLAVFSFLLLIFETLIGLGKMPPMSPIWEEFFHHLLPIFATYMMFAVGKPYLLGLYRFLRYGKANMDTLIGLGTLTAFVYSFVVAAFEESLGSLVNVKASYYDITIVVIAFITLGKYLEAKSKLKTGDAIEKLLNLQAKTALVRRNGKEEELPVQMVVHGDLIVVRPGGSLPVDGVVVEGVS
jgi:Cu2+-exporting ATPase/Cu+-exporting ATPase